MAKVHGKDGQIKIGDNVCPVENWSFEETVPTDDATEQGDAGQDHLTGIPGWTGELTVIQNKDNPAHQALSVGAVVSVELYDGGTGSGAKYWTGTASVITRGRTVNKDANIRQTISLQGKGVLVESTVGGGS